RPHQLCRRHALWRPDPRAFTRDLRGTRRPGPDPRSYLDDATGRRLCRARGHGRGRLGDVQGVRQPARDVDLGGRGGDRPGGGLGQPWREERGCGVGKTPRPGYPHRVAMAIIVATLLLFLAGPFVLWPLIRTPEEGPGEQPHPAP